MALAYRVQSNDRKAMDRNCGPGNGCKPKVQLATKFIVRIIGLFNGQMKELFEMLYQYDRDYVFDSSKFESHFNFEPTGYSDGIKTTIETDFSSTSN